MPRSLPLEGKREWKRVADELEGAGVLTEVDRSSLIRYCQTWAEWLDVTAQIERTGTLIRRSRDDGELRRNPLLFVRRELSDTLDRLSAQLLITPASRLRAGIAHETAEDARRPEGVTSMQDYRAMAARLAGEPAAPSGAAESSQGP